jgi:hypothetical protein
MKLNEIKSSLLYGNQFIKKDKRQPPSLRYGGQRKSQDKSHKIKGKS